MNFVFFSPHFPGSSTEFAIRLHEEGATVLGIGDAAYDSLDPRLQRALTEYYRVDSMEDEDRIVRACGFFTHKYGRLDRFESLNEYWLETDARIRTDFNVYGTKADFVDNLKQKSKMKDFFQASGVDTVRFLKNPERESAAAFIEQNGFPVVVKPDLGSGASMTYKIRNQGELDYFFHTRPQDIEFIMEEFIDGIILTYDGLIDQSGIVRFQASHRFDQSIMKVVGDDDHLHYICLDHVDPEVERAGRNILRAFDIRERFFHIELFKSNKDGRLIALEVNMRPPGAWMTDSINYSYDVDVYSLWAKMVVHGGCGDPPSGHYYTGYASRKDRKHYAHSHQEIVQSLGDSLVRYDEIEAVFSRASGNRAYQFRAKTLDEVRGMVAYIQEER
ncbi:ATP-grasp domain-containing protein [Saccharibacillus sp. CPCC 101409]|uniref:ATP-grasp domain-containing protein n=1 Tax=Saccharibacillus sp. CPCC 101409 TaxID=3058041 RepID=UPI00267225DD|nr:ATP-grasp domain-containing protein [Saccharibacillus sp. CPCC 101409]MDO3409418.1 ATP-grasp domain-containing protein [Saccharibacillus sp. CPCC 101409]